MTRLRCFGIILLISFLSFTQNNTINYKALVKDNSGNPLSSQNIDIRFTIFVGPTQVYQETHVTSTDTNGIAIINIGAGTTGDNFSTIDWVSGTTSLKTEIDSGAGFVDLGTTEFKAVPYALNVLNSSGFPNGDITINGKLRVNEDSPSFSDNAIEGIKTYNPNSFTDSKGVYGSNTIDDFYGIGVQGDGGYQGVRGQVGGTGDNFYYGVSGSAYGSNLGTNYGVYGYAAGGATNYAVYAAGDMAHTGALINASDRKLKTNIQQIDANSALQLIRQLNPSSYTFKAEYVKTMHVSAKPQMGFIAQELQEVFPQLVSTNKHPGATKTDPSVDYMGVNYIGLIPVLTAGIKEQQSIIDRQQQTIHAQEQVLQNLLARVEALENRN
ncbi:MAG: hypothetical protein HKN40_14250 [Winogradskyella sp.]|uniref:tail fiber domain-containing protein n=1 Tax=Winogradskyella sp. TaxID=1883156 RepID=UPI0017C33A5D|nr:hypothetical protein [Winogradskyella sp.]